MKSKIDKIFRIIFPVFLLVFCSSSLITPSNLTIKNLRVYGETETAFPIFSPDFNSNFTIEFDIDSDEIPSLNILFRYCDKDWRPYENLFLVNTGRNIEYNLVFEILPFTCQDARYHYKGVFPNRKDFVDFPFSGKWMFFIVDVQDTSKVFALGQFYVVLSEFEMNIQLKNEMLEEKSFNPIEIGRIVNLTASFDLPEELFPNFVDHVEIIQNRKVSEPFIVERFFNTNTRQYSWNGDRKFSFTARDIYPGNEYRQADLRDTNKFISETVNAQFSGFDISRFYKIGRRDLNGSSVMTDYRNDYATYLNVNFRIQPPDDFYGDIFLVGAFNNWQLSEDYRLIENRGIYSKSIELKRGLYDYQYVTGSLLNGKIENENWIYLEGNFWETANEYHVFLYYRDPNYGGYDKIIAFKKIISRIK